MITPDEIKARALRLWNSGRVLRAWLGGDEVFPLTLPAGRPTAAQLLRNFSKVQGWKADLEAGCKCRLDYGYRIEYAEINHRKLGRQRLPKRVIFDAVDDLVAYIRKRAELTRFARLAKNIRYDQPALTHWIERYPMKVLEHEEDWSRLLAVIAFFKINPVPNRYLRELDIKGVDTKFIERRKGLIAELLDTVLPADAIDPGITGLASHGFERRYGLKYDQATIRFRWLDTGIVQYYGELDDLSVPISRFSNLDPPCRRVFITENKINGLSFPQMPESMIIFGLGYGISSLKNVEWLHSKAIYYWGDIDTHGFSILSQLRGYFLHARSFLMDRSTLERFQKAWVQEQETKRFIGEPEHLSDTERQLYRLLHDNRLGKRVRLEQERIAFEYLAERLGRLQMIND
ncbi:MAG: Wadjet anti-phage system protein JetD domain-containing protein [Pseudomonadota bacterium]